MSETGKKPWPKILGAVLLLVVAVAAYKMFPGESEAPEYNTEKVRRKTVKAFVAATGTIESTTTVTVGSQVSGPVSEVLVDFNTPVKKGQVLAKIDPSEFLARQAQAQANLQSALASLTSAQATLAGQQASVQQAEVAVTTARAGLQQIEASLDASRAGVRTAEANLDSRKAERENNLIQYKRAEDLVQRELVALSERDTARTNFLVASAAVETAEAGLQQARSQLAQTEAQVVASRTEIRAAEARLASARAQAQASAAQVGAAQATVDQARAGVQQANVDLVRTTITSPIDGVVIQRKVDVGSTVQASFNVPELFVIARDLSKMQVKAEVSEADIGRVEEGAEVTFAVDAYQGKDFKGKVVQVRSAPDKEENSTSNVVVYGVLVTASNPENLLKPGMTATVEILAEEIKDALVVNSQALRFVPKGQDEEEGKGKKRGRKPKPSPSPSETPAEEVKLEPGTRKAAVWVLKNDTPEKRDIITGISSEDDVVVVSGDLKEGEDVILSEEESGEPKRRFRLSL